MSRISRRSFLAGSAAAAGSMLLPHAQVRGANSDIRVAVVGFNGRGMGHIQELLGVPGARIVALCDVDPAVLARGIKAVSATNPSVQGYADVRKLLESKEI